MTRGSLYRRAVVVALPLIAILSSPVVRAADTSSEERKAVEAAIAAVKPALVRIYVAEVDYEQGREIKAESSGSGVIVTKEGHVVTNHHVAGWAKRLVCTLSNREEVEADLIGTDALTDIAVIKLRLGNRKEFPVAQWGDSSKLKVGDRVLAMGSPLSLSQSVTMGIVSNTELIMPEYLGGSMTLDGEDVGSMVRWIGHDALIQGGNSGGPLVNLNGQIIGINEISLGYGDGGIGGAIPSNVARKVAEQIIKNGKVSRSWIGINIQPLLKSSTVKRGVLIGGIFPDSPAAAAGFKPGDILIRLAGKDVNVQFSEELPVFNQEVASLPVGKEVEAVVLRGGKEVKLKVKTQERPEAEPRPREFKQWGMCAANISLIKAREQKRPNQDGVILWTASPGGPCGEAKPSISSGDIIVEVNGKPVKNIDDLTKITEELTEGKTEPTPVLVAFDRGNERLLTVVKVGIRPLDEPGKEIRKAYLPADIQVITRDIAEALGLEDRTGVRITNVYPDSAAQDAGLKVGDLIVAIDGQEIPAREQQDTEVLPAMIRQYKVGTTVEFTVIRGKDEIKVPMLLEQSPPLQRELMKYRDDVFEFTARDIGFKDRVRQNLEKTVTGVYVEEISQGGWAALGRLSVGDIIYSVDGQPVNNVAELKQIMGKIHENKPKHVVIRVRRGVQEMFVELETDWSGSK
ncbi:MAG TPA: PDZ domain-containing protein [Armatimonadota bacterium]|nr:PDZ domain-containing protein [Armatimonadota bacterium]